MIVNDPDDYSSTEARVFRSAERLIDLLRMKVTPPAPIVDGEFKILTQSIAMLIGPDRIRQWMDDVTEKSLSALHGR